MQRALKYSAVATPVLLLLAFTAWLMPADDAGAAYGCGTCGPIEYTATVTGSSNVDCPWAEMDAKNRALALIDCGPNAIECGGRAAEIVSACVPGPLPLTATARARFRCRDCEDPEEP